MWQWDKQVWYHLDYHGDSFITRYSQENQGCWICEQFLKPVTDPQLQFIIYVIFCVILTALNLTVLSCENFVHLLTSSQEYEKFIIMNNSNYQERVLGGRCEIYYGWFGPFQANRMLGDDLWDCQIWITLSGYRRNTLYLFFPNFQ